MDVTTSFFGGTPGSCLPQAARLAFFPASCDVIVPGPKRWPWTVRSLCDCRAVGEDGLVNQPNSHLDDHDMVIMVQQLEQRL